MDNAQGKPVMFRTLDIGSDKVLPYMKPQDEPNPAMGWRAIRVGLDKRGVLRMQLQALIRASVGRPLHVMFPFIADITEYEAAHRILMQEMAREQRLGHSMPSDIRVGAMLETPSLAFAPKRFFEMCDFISIGGNDLKQFFFAADRENERVRRRYDTLNVSFCRCCARSSRAAPMPACRCPFAARMRAAGRGAGLCGPGHPPPVDAAGVDRTGQAPHPAHQHRRAGPRHRGGRGRGPDQRARPRDGLACTTMNR